ncbi:MAG: exo-alpha-sialidase, partial [Bradyrhizobium sp.]|nr:exo-alpha-sialidase [Bradyrhizobium sp.]
MTSKARLRSGLLGLAIAVFAPLTGHAQMAHQHGSDAACEGTELRCATKVTPFFAQDGKLWLAWMAGGRVSVASSTDAGKTYSASVPVNEQPLNLDWGPDARPKLVVDGKGGIAVAFSIFRDQAFN